MMRLYRMVCYWDSRGGVLLGQGFHPVFIQSPPMPEKITIFQVGTDSEYISECDRICACKPGGYDIKEVTNLINQDQATVWSVISPTVSTAYSNDFIECILLAWYPTQFGPFSKGSEEVEGRATMKCVD